MASLESVFEFESGMRVLHNLVAENDIDFPWKTIDKTVYHLTRPAPPRPRLVRRDWLSSARLLSCATGRRHQRRIKELV